MKSKLLSAVLAAAVLSGTGGALRLGAEVRTARQTPFGARQEIRQGLMHLVRDAEELNISADQKQEIRSIVQKYWPEVKPLLSTLNDSGRKLRDIIRDAPYNEDGIRTAVYERAGVVARLAVLRGKITAEIRGVLTPEQDEIIRGVREGVEEKLELLPQRIEEFLFNPHS